jgi:hypothetical protein
MIGVLSRDLENTQEFGPIHAQLRPYTFKQMHGDDCQKKESVINHQLIYSEINA